MKRFLVLIAMVGCGSNGGGGNSDGVAGDDTMQIDAPPGPSGLTETTLTCTDFTRTVTNADGSKTVTTYRNAVVDGLAPTDNYVVVTCYPAGADPLSVNTCPNGATCTGAVYPPGPVCFVNRSLQTFGGKMTVQCGYSAQSFNSGGTMTSSYSNIPESVKLYR